MLIRVVNQAGVRGTLMGTSAATRDPHDRKLAIHLHAEDGELMPGYRHPLFEPVAPEDAERDCRLWAVKNGWSRVLDED